MDSQPESKLPELKTTSRMLFTDAMLIAAVPAVTFLVAYCYDFGYASKFEIPLQLVSVTWGNALAACLFGFIFVIFGWTGYIQVFPTGGGKFALIILAISLGIGAFIVSGHPLFLLLVGGLGVAIVMLLRLMIYPGSGRKLDKLAEVSQQHMRRLENDPLYSLALILVLGTVFSFGFGRYRALHQAEFYVVPTSPESVLLAEYGDIFVLEHFDRKTKKLEGGIIVMKLADGSPLTLQLEKVGPLKAPDEK